jgi:DNA-binding GntR family transcriptional regulator
MARASQPLSSVGDVAQVVREVILSGRFKVGERITEAGLTKRFNVGRGVVREAIHRLTHQGLLLTRPNCGAVVAPEAPKAIRGLIVPIRRALEVYALRVIIDDLDEADFRNWDEVLERMREACERNDNHAVADADIAFHRLLLERSGQPDLIVIWETLVGRIRSHFRRMQRRCANLMDLYEEHRELVNAFRSGDERVAVRLLKEKIA